MTLTAVTIKRPLRSALLVALLMASVLTAVAPAHGAGPTQLSYIVMPHPDDELGVHSLVTGASTNYQVVVYLTQGGGSTACTAITGKSWFQGPNNIPYPNYGERNPVSTSYNLWGGKYSNACEAGRREATLDWWSGVGLNDGALPRNFIYRGTKNGTGWLSSAMVYEGGNGQGVVIFFDFPDGTLTRSETTWAVKKVRDNKSLFSVPNLPSYNALGAYRTGPQGYPGCTTYAHIDHTAVHESLWNDDMNIGRQHGRTCSTDGHVAAWRTQTMPAGVHNSMKSMSGNTRLGHNQVIYGWLKNTPWSNFGADNTWARTQHFWSRFS